tara:strand:- start:3486 stop:5741 length:2256 start_codon:yes stop_codon:yes gene_type:complete
MLVLANYNNSCLAQDRIVINGFVEDSLSGERISGANVYSEEGAVGTATNNFGFFTITIPADTIDLVVSFIGYKTLNIKFFSERDTTILLELVPITMQLTQVEIISFRPKPHVAILTAKQIEALPALLGETDVMRLVQTLPGVQGGLEGFSGLHVRGGSPDQNLLMLDGAQVYNANHLFGLYSVFNSDVVKSIELTKGAFPARFGGRLSSILEVNLREGNNKKFAGGGSIGLVSSRFFVEGPIIKNKMSFLFSARRTYFDLLTAALGQDFLAYDFFFDDFNFKVNYTISEKDKLYLSTYTGRDKYSTGDFVIGDESTQLSWQNVTSVMRWNRVYSKKLFANLSLHFTKYNITAEQSTAIKNQGESINLGATNESNIADFGFSYVFNQAVNQIHELNYGLHYLLHNVNPSISQYITPINGSSPNQLPTANKRILGNEISVFMEDNWSLSTRLGLILGLHYSAYETQGTFYNLLQPRLSAQYEMTDRWSINASYSSMNQYVHLLTNLGFGLPADLWVASTDRIQPQESHQWAIANLYRLDNWTTDLRFEAYYKRMKHLISYKEGVAFTYRTNWEDLLLTGGQGTAYGFEWSAEHQKDKLSARFNYTLSWSNRQFEEINDGEEYPYRYDRRHVISLIGGYAFSQKFSLNASWSYLSGQAFTAPLSILDFTSGTGIEYSDRNALRFPSYHRLDLGFQFKKKTSWGERTWSFSVYNAYNRINPFFILPLENENNNQMELKVFSLFPIIPSFQYSFRF